MRPTLERLRGLKASGSTEKRVRGKIYIKSERERRMYKYMLLSISKTLNSSD